MNIGIICTALLGLLLFGLGLARFAATAEKPPQHRL